MKSQAQSLYDQMCQQIETLIKDIGLSCIPKIKTNIECEDEKLANIELEHLRCDNSTLHNEVYVYLAFTDYSTNWYPLIYAHLHGIITLGHHIDSSLYTGSNPNDRINCHNTVDKIACQLVTPARNSFLMNGESTFALSRYMYPIFVFTYEKYKRMLNFINDFASKYSGYKIEFETVFDTSPVASCVSVGNSSPNLMQTPSMMSPEMFVFLHVFGCLCIYRDYPEDSLYDIVELKNCIFRLVPHDISSNWDIVSPRNIITPVNSSGPRETWPSNQQQSLKFPQNIYKPKIKNRENLPENIVTDNLLFPGSTSKSIESDANDRDDPSKSLPSDEKNTNPQLSSNPSGEERRREDKAPVPLARQERTQTPENGNVSEKKTDSRKQTGDTEQTDGITNPAYIQVLSDLNEVNISVYKTVDSDAMMQNAVEPYVVYDTYHRPKNISRNDFTYLDYKELAGKFYNLNNKSLAHCFFTNLSNVNVSSNNKDIQNFKYRFGQSMNKLLTNQRSGDSSKYMNTYEFKEIPDNVSMKNLYQDPSIFNLYYMFYILLFNICKTCYSCDQGNCCLSDKCNTFIKNPDAKFTFLIEECKKSYDKNKLDEENKTAIIEILVLVPPVYLIDISKHFH